jgi:mRNA interferase RelE/StbE
MNVKATNAFRKEMNRLQLQDIQEVIDALKELRDAQTLSELSNLRKMKGSKDMFRLKVGRYRILIRWIKEEQILEIQTIADRKDIYKKR